MPHGRRSAPERERIREVFLARRESYDLSAAAQLLGISEEAVREAAAGGSEPRMGWEDVVALGLEQRWTYRMLTEALGPDAAALPLLVRVVPRRVLLPRYQWDVLGLLAARRARDEQREITVSDVIEEAVAAYLAAIDDWGALEASLPGVRAAAMWP